MSLSIQSRSDRNVQIITVAGHLTLGPSLRVLQQAAREALASGSPEGLIMDVSGVRFADSAGLGELTIVYTLCSRRKCALVLLGVPAQLRQMLDLTRLDALLVSAASIDEAKQQIKAHKGRNSTAANSAASGE